MATYAGLAWYSFRLGKNKAEEHRILPFKEAAEGWESVAAQQSMELGLVKSQVQQLQTENESLKKKYEDLEQDYLKATRTNYRLQGEVDQLKTRVTELETLKEMFSSAIREIKNPDSGR